MDVIWGLKYSLAMLRFNLKVGVNRSFSIEKASSVKQMSLGFSRLDSLFLVLICWMSSIITFLNSASCMIALGSSALPIN